MRTTAHELNNHLAVIVGNAALLARRVEHRLAATGDQDLTDVIEDIAAIRAAGEAATQVTRDLYARAHGQAGETSA